jgi:hypothetical protein
MSSPLPDSSPILDASGRLLSPYTVAPAYRDLYLAEVMRRLRTSDPSDTRPEVVRFRESMQSLLDEMNDLLDERYSYAFLSAFYEVVRETYDAAEFDELVGYAHDEVRKITNR